MADTGPHAGHAVIHVRGFGPAAAQATVLLSNHSEFDNAVTRAKMLAGRGDGPHPFEIGTDLVQRYVAVTRNGARAAQIMLERLAGRS